MSDVINVKWYSGGAGTVGFVLTSDDVTGKIMCYTGCTKALDMDIDINMIKGYGAKVEKEVAEAIFGCEFINYKTL